MLKIILLLIVGAVAVSALKNECPPPETIACSCEIRWGPSVTCSGDISEEEGQKTANVLKDYSLSRLTLEKMVFPRVDQETLKGLTIDHFILDRVSVIEPFKEGVLYYEGPAKSMTVLEISHCYKTGAPLAHNKLDYVENLESVLMNDNNILEIGNDWFATGPKKLETLLLESNNIQRLGDKAFNALTGLKVLWIRGSDLGHIKRSMLPSPAPVLEKLDISNNKLTEIPTDLFADMPAIRAVSINDNLIKTISSEIWPPTLTSSTNLYLDGNPFRCDSNLKWVCKIKANTKAASCDSPDEKKGIILSAFCDM